MKDIKKHSFFLTKLFLKGLPGNIKPEPERASLRCSTILNARGHSTKRLKSMIYTCNPSSSPATKRVLNIQAFFPSVKKWLKMSEDDRNTPLWYRPWASPDSFIIFELDEVSWVFLLQGKSSFLGPICAFSTKKGGKGAALEKNHGAPPSPLGGKSERPASCLLCCRCHSVCRKNTANLNLRY